MKSSAPKIVNVINSAFLLPALFRGQMSYLKSCGFDLHIATQGDKYLDAFAKIEPITPLDLPISRSISPLRDLVSIVRLCSELQRIRPTIVHTHTPKGGLIGMIASWLMRVPVRIYHIHGLPMSTSRGLKHLLLKYCEMLCCRLAHQVLCVSHSVKTDALAEGLCPTEKLTVPLHGSANGVDCERYSPALRGENDSMRQQLGIPSDAMVIGFVGRLKSEKGIVELAAAWKTIRKQSPKAWLLLVGPFDEQDAIPSEVRRSLESDDHVLCVGRVADAHPYFSVIDIAVLPSYREGLSTFLLEAMATGIPSVTTNVPGCHDLIETGINGTVIPPQDAASLETALSSYINDKALRLRHGRAARQRCLERYTQPLIWDALLEIYETQMQSNGYSIANRELPIDHEARRAA